MRQSFGAMAQGVLMVVAADETHRSQLQLGLHTFLQIDVPLLGFVFNKVGAARGYYGYYYYYTYYQKYYSDEGLLVKAPRRRHSHDRGWRRVKRDIGRFLKGTFRGG